MNHEPRRTPVSIRSSERSPARAILVLSDDRRGVRWGVYSASKAGVIAITQAMARELACDGVRVNAICPGTFDTPLAERVLRAYAARAGTTPEAMRESYARDAIGLGRFGSPDEMGAVCAFLAGDDASFITGAAINLTGGEQYFF
jgi:NAD(P)-dependent dehydrogenase (short-subunit alcohol dehydrogenase family)